MHSQVFLKEYSPPSHTIKPSLTSQQSEFCQLYSKRTVNKGCEFSACNDIPMCKTFKI